MPALRSAAPLAVFPAFGVLLILLASGYERPLGESTEPLAVVYTSVGVEPLAQGEVEVEEERGRSLMLHLPTSNDNLLRGNRPGFYMGLDATVPRLRPERWMGGQYGFVRNVARTPAGPTFTRVHQGVDIRPLHRDARGEPLDTVRAIGDGRVVFANRAAGGSNYGRYVILRHDWDGSDVYTLSAHLATVSVANGAAVAAGAPLGRMGYTGVGLDRARAHLHLEVGLMLNQHYARWHQAFYGSRDPRGRYFPRNLMGLDPSALFLALEEDPYLTFAEFVGRQPVAFRLALPGDRPLDVLARYPWMGTGGATVADAGRPGAWVVGFTREGVPVEIGRQAASVREPSVLYVSDEVRRGHLATGGLLARTGNGYQLTRAGKAHAALLATTASSVPRWF